MQIKKKKLNSTTQHKQIQTNKQLKVKSHHHMTLVNC